MKYTLEVHPIPLPWILTMLLLIGLQSLVFTAQLYTETSKMCIFGQLIITDTRMTICYIIFSIFMGFRISTVQS